MDQAIGNLFIVAAPSGAGKSTLVNALLASDSSIKLSISFTTRAPRPGELNGREYHFVSAADFASMRAAGEFIESAEVHGNWYGTSQTWIAAQIAQGDDVLLEIDWQGARQIKSQFPDAVGIFILPPSIDALEARLRARGQDAPAIIARRLLAAGGEIAHARDFDYVIINQEFAAASQEFSCIVGATRLRFASQARRHARLFAQFGIHAGP